MDNNHIQPVSPGQKVQAQTINQLIDSVDFSVKTTGARTHIGKDVNIQVNDQGQRMFFGQKFREPFDLSVGKSEQKMAITVTRAHAPNSQGSLDDIQISESPMTFPAEEEVKVYFCELSSGGRKIMWSTDENLSAAKSKTVMWKIGTNGVVLEDLRGSFLGSGQQIELDLSSLNWKKNDDDEDTTTAQLWHYDELLSDDIADKSELTATPGWMFPIRPPDGLPHLKYVELSTLSSVAGGCECDLEQVLTSGTKIARWTPDGQNWTDIYAPPGGGGGGCSCDLSAEPPTQISSTWAQPVKTASWTKDNWQTQKDIYVPDFGGACTYFNLRNTYTCFAYYPTMNTVARGTILNCAFWYGRRWQVLNNIQVTQPGTYYLEVDTASTSPSFTIRHNSSTAVPPPKSLMDQLTTETVSVFPLWVIPDAVQTLTTGIPFDCRTALNLPFYSN